MGIVWKGGPAHRAPYRTTHVRVPVPIKDQVQALVDLFKREALEDYPASDSVNDYPRLPIVAEKQAAPDIDAAIAILTEALDLKANAGGKIKARIRDALAILSEET